MTLEAGNRLDVTGSELIAGKNLTLDGREVSITAAENQSSQTRRVEQKTSGLTLALSGTVGRALNTATQTVQEAKSADSGRLAALQATKAALNGVEAVQAARLAAAQGNSPENSNTIGISLSYGSQSSTSIQRSEQRTAQGSSLTAGDNLSVVARGSGVKGADGDLRVQGSQLQAGKDVLLSANRDLSLLSAENTSSLEGKNESHGGTLGVGVGVGQGGWGFNISASVNKSKGSEQGSGVTHTETQVSAGNQVTMVSGRDTLLQGAQVSGERVKADVGRNLTLASEQDSDRYDSKQQSVSAGGSFNIGSMTGSASLSASRDKMHSNWQSVEEQTGIFAGKGGFDVTVGEHTQLDGAGIGSPADASLNKLETGTLGFSDIENRADYKVEHQSAGISTGGSIAGQFAGNMANGLLVGANHSGSDSSTTKAAVSEGAIVIRDQASQAQEVSGLSRDVEHANQTLSPIFDKEKEQNRLQEAQLIGEIGNQAADIVRTQGQIAATKAANERMKSVTPDQLKAAEAEWRAAHPDKEPKAGDISGQVYQTFYNEAFNASGLGTGSTIQQGIQAATAAVQGLAGGNLAQAVSGAAAPYLAEVIHDMTTTKDANGHDVVNVQANLMAHAVVGAVTAYAAGNSAVAGASGAAMGEYIAQQMYPGVKREDLTEDQRQTISTLGTLAAALAGGVTGDSTAGAVAGAQAGKNAVENNSLSGLDGFGTGFWNNVQAQGALVNNTNLTDETGKVLNPATPEEIRYASDKLVTGELPDSANITKAIVDGYKDGVLIAGSMYLGPAASVGKVLSGGVIAEIANGTYQWFDLNKSGNENKTWDYKGSISAGISGMLAPGRDVWQNAAIAVGASIFNDGLDKSSLAGTGAGWVFGTTVGIVAPPVFDPVLGAGSAPVGDIIGAVGGEFISNVVKDEVKKNDKKK